LAPHANDLTSLSVEVDFSVERAESRRSMESRSDSNPRDGDSPRSNTKRRDRIATRKTIEAVAIGRERVYGDQGVASSRAREVRAE
jgi:hypothetical protein